jgi:hypothetical protein
VLVIAQTSTNDQTVTEHVGIIAFGIALDLLRLGTPTVGTPMNTDPPASSA